MSCTARKNSPGRFSTRPFVLEACRREDIFLRGAGVTVESLFMSLTPNQARSSILTGKVDFHAVTCSGSLLAGGLPWRLVCSL